MSTDAFEQPPTDVGGMTGAGSAYYLSPGVIDKDLTSVERGTPGGELLRRYWQPVAVARDIADLPVAVRALGEDLVLFRSAGGGFGLVHPRCAHRGTSLLYGKVEDRGIRCCYHGWLFDTEGRCLEMPCEPAGSEAWRSRIRQPWYPTRERYGLVFAYMGPPDKMPALPKYDNLEHIGPSEFINANGNSIGFGGPKEMPCNWLQTHENVVDPWHLFVLHSTFSTAQFSELTRIRPDISWAYTDAGVSSIQLRELPNQGTLRRVGEIVVPNVRIVADPRIGIFGPGTNVAWTLPIDETHTKVFTVLRLPIGVPTDKLGEGAIYDGKTWFELTAEGHQRHPGDYEAQASQGAVTIHSEEHLASSDRGIGMFRRLLRQEMKKVAAGEDPMNVQADGADHIYAVKAGNFLTTDNAAVTVAT
jgi:nitrite reductase/ring-hydroxylating ferredoxin subunit